MKDMECGTIDYYPGEKGIFPRFKILKRHDGSIVIERRTMLFFYSTLKKMVSNWYDDWYEDLTFTTESAAKDHISKLLTKEKISRILRKQKPELIGTVR